MTDETEVTSVGRTFLSDAFDLARVGRTLLSDNLAQ